MGVHQKALIASIAEKSALDEEAVKLDERLAWKAERESMRSYYDDPAIFVQVRYEGHEYEVCVYTLRDCLEFEIASFAETEDGVEYVASPIAHHGHAFETRRTDGPFPAEKVQGVAERVVAELVEEMRPIRVKQDGNIVTPEDVRVEIARLLQKPVYQGQTWDEYRERGGITDEELEEVLKHKFGSSGSCGPRRMSVSREGAGLRLWMDWHTVNTYSTKPRIEGKATLAVAREIMETDHGLLNPDNPQMGLF